VSIGNFASRAMELGGFPRRGVECDTVEHSKVECDTKPPVFGAGSINAEAIIGEGENSEGRFEPGPAPALSEIRLIQAMRKIDPDLAHMIESLAPVYLVSQGK